VKTQKGLEHCIIFLTLQTTLLLPLALILSNANEYSLSTIENNDNMSYLELATLHITYLCKIGMSSSQTLGKPAPIANLLIYAFKAIYLSTNPRGTPGGWGRNSFAKLTLLPLYSSLFLCLFLPLRTSKPTHDLIILLAYSKRYHLHTSKQYL
jgi:hypothetical protein